MKHWYFLFLFLLSFYTIKGADPVKSSKTVANTFIKNDRIDKLFESALYELNASDNTRAYDSLARIAIEHAESTFDADLILQTSLKYLKNISAGSRFNIMDVVQRVELLISNLDNTDQKFECSIIMSDAILNSYQETDKAEQFALDAMNIANGNDNKVKKILASLAVGRVLLFQNKITPAYQNLLNAQIQYESLSSADQSAELNKLINDRLYNFYFKIRAYDKAERIKIKEINRQKGIVPVDSVDLMWSYYDMADLLIILNRKADVESSLLKIMDFAERKNNKKLLNWSLSLARTFYIDQQNFKGLYQLYRNRFPLKLQKLQDQSPDVYCLIRGYLCEEDQKVDSAFVYFTLAEEHIKEGNNPYKLSNFYMRLGQLHMRNDNEIEALKSIEKSYKIAESIPYEDAQLEAATLLEMLAVKAEDFNKAYYYSEKENHLQLALRDRTEEEELTRMNLDAQEEILLVQETKKQKETKRKYNLQYFAVAIGIIALFILMIILSSFQVPPWVIEMLGFFSVLFIFEFIILLLDHELHHMTHGAPLPLFGLKVLILSFLFPLHHLIEHTVINYLQKNKLLSAPSSSGIKASLARLWPWLGEKKEGHDGH